MKDDVDLSMQASVDTCNIAIRKRKDDIDWWIQLHDFYRSRKPALNSAAHAVKLLQSLRDFVADLLTSPTAFNDFEEQVKSVAVVKTFTRK